MYDINPKEFLCIFGAVSCHLETWPNFNKQNTNSTHNNFLSSSNTCVELIPSFQSDLPLCVYIKIQPWNTGLSVIRHGPSPDLYILQTPKSFQGITFYTKSSTSKLAVETPHVCKMSCTQMIYPHQNYIIYYSWINLNWKNTLCTFMYQQIHPYIQYIYDSWMYRIHAMILPRPSNLGVTTPWRIFFPTSCAVTKQATHLSFFLSKMGSYLEMVWQLIFSSGHVQNWKATLW